MRIGVTEMRERLAETLAAVARGERVEVQRHGRTIAVIMAPGDAEALGSPLQRRLAILADQRWAEHREAPKPQSHFDIFGTISAQRIAGLAYTAGARLDLMPIRDPAARGRIERAIVGLVADPLQAPLLPQSGDSDARHMAVTPWHICYRIETGGVLVLAVAVESETGSA